MQKNIAANRFSSLTAVNQAVSTHSGRANFYTMRSPGSLRSSLVKDRELERTVPVTITRLASVLKGKRVTYLKMDIEGHESVIFQDLAKSKVLDHIAQAGVEYHHHITPQQPSAFGKFLMLLEDHGFKYQLATRSAPPPTLARTSWFQHTGASKMDFNSYDQAKNPSHRQHWPVG